MSVKMTSFVVQAKLQKLGHFLFSKKMDAMLYQEGGEHVSKKA